MDSYPKFTVTINSAQKITVSISVPILIVLIGASVLSPDYSYSLHYYFGTYGIHWFILGLVISVFEFFWWKIPVGEITISKKVLFRSYYVAGGLGIFWILLGVICPGYNTDRSDEAILFKSICLGVSLILLPWIFHLLWIYVKQFARWIDPSIYQKNLNKQSLDNELEKRIKPPPLPESHSTSLAKQNPAEDAQ